MAALTTADCGVISDLFARETGRFAPTIQKRITGKSVILDNIKRGPFPDGMGTTINVLTTERSLDNTNDGDDWTSISTPSAGQSGGICLPASSTVDISNRSRSFSLYRTAIQSPNICLEDLRTQFDIRQQLGNTVASMTQTIKWRLEQHAINEYIKNVAYTNLWNVRDGVTTATAGAIGTAAGVFGVNPPTSALTAEVLQAAYMNLFRDSGGEGAMGMSGARHIYTLFCSPETSWNLIAENATIRQDHNYAFEGSKMESPLLRGYGVDRAYGNFAHVEVPHMPRYTFADGVFTRVNYYLRTANGDGTYRYEVNSNYLSATYEASIIFNPLVYEWLVPGAVNPGGGTSFSTPDYFPATFKWLNIPHAVCNPDSTIGFFRAVLASASMPVHPEYGYVLLHLRCGPALKLTGCPTGS